jgi:hypothetical protein
MLAYAMVVGLGARGGVSAPGWLADEHGEVGARAGGEAGKSTIGWTVRGRTGVCCVVAKSMRKSS